MHSSLFKKICLLWKQTCFFLMKQNLPFFKQNLPFLKWKVSVPTVLTSLYMCITLFAEMHNIRMQFNRMECWFIDHTAHFIETCRIYMYIMFDFQHGRLKVKTTAEQQEAKRKERDRKLKLYTAGTSKVFSKVQSNNTTNLWASNSCLCVFIKHRISKTLQFVQIFLYQLQTMHFVNISMFTKQWYIEKLFMIY